MSQDSDPLSAFLDRATGALRDDPELRLDVRAELTAHVEERLREQQGENLADSQAEALRHLGSVDILADDLLKANRRRMQRRARIRLLLRAVLVPAAVLVALLPLVTTIMPQGKATESLYVMISSANQPFLRVVTLGRLGSWRRHTADERLILEGDPGRSNPADAARAIWERWPDNPVYYGHYISKLIAPHSGRLATGSGSAASGEAEFAEQIAALRQGMELEPDNALYPYLLASFLLQRAATLEEDDSESGRTAKPPLKDRRYRLVVTNREDLDAGMAIFVSATQKPRLNRHQQAMFRERLRIIGPPRSLIEHTALAARASGILLSDLQHYRHLARMSVAYGRLLGEEGRTDEAATYLDLWLPLTRHMAQAPFGLIDVLVMSAVAQHGEYAADIYDQLGEGKKADWTRTACETVTAPITHWQTHDRALAANSEDLTRNLRYRASIMASLLLPALGENVPQEAFTPGRMLEYVCSDRALVSALGLALLTVIGGGTLVVLRWRWAPGASAAPILLLPDLHTTARILGLGVILPVGVYLAISLCPALSGRAYNLTVSWPRTVTLALLLVTSVTLTLGRLCRSAVQRRCAILGIPFPRAPGRARLLLLIAPLSGIWLLDTLRYTITSDVGPAPGPWNAAVLVTTGMCALLLLLYGACACIRALVAKPEYAMYHGTVARSMLPLIAAAILLVSLPVQPWLSARETHLVQHDPLLGFDMQNICFTRAEGELTQRLASQTRKALAQIPAPPED